jgi:pilus assembly protein CpaF
MLINRMDLTKLSMLEPDQLHDEVARLASNLLAMEETPLSTVERERLIHEVRHELFGLGPLEQLLADSSISDIPGELPVQHLHRAWWQTRTHEH